jgi:hypothetical protein
VVALACFRARVASSFVKLRMRRYWMRSSSRV